MAVPTAYLTSTKNTKKIFESIQKASVPAQGFTYEFLKQLGYASSSDRPIIPVLKAIGFLDGSGRPTELYRTYKDPSSAGVVLARALREGYADLFAIDTRADTKTHSELSGMFARLTDKGDSVTQKMAMTFHELAKLGTFSDQLPSEQADEVADDLENEVGASGGRRFDRQRRDALHHDTGKGGFSLRHDIHVHLPLSTDVAVYDAIFRSLRENLL